MSRTAIVLGAVLVVTGGGLLGYAVTRKAADPQMTSEQVAAMTSAKDKLDAELKDAHTAASVRADTISQNSYLRNGLKTMDRDTVVDQVVNGDAKYDPSKGEVIEVGSYNDKGGFDVLALQPADAKPVKYPGKRPAPYVALAGNRMTVYAVTEVKDGDKPIGYVTVAQSRELAGAFADLAKAGIAGRFELGGEQVAIGGGVPADAASSQSMALTQDGAKLVVATPKAASAGAPIALYGAGAGAAGLGLLVIAIGMLGGRKQEPEVVPPPSASMQPSSAGGNEIDPNATKFSGQLPVAAGTPSPVDFGSGPAQPGINPSNIGAGAMIGRWEVIRRLGSGGMADVYLAHSKGEAGFEKLVAIKVMHGHLARNERAVEHFLDEARLAARIHHPNVVAIQDLGKIGSDYVIVMEYVDGVDLERLLISSRNANRLVPVDVGLGILCRICDGLNAAYTATGPDGVSLQIIHRDVKAANVLVSRQGSVKVVDFGIAKAARQSHMTVAGETKGTPSMMAPEQRVGELVDVRADVYSVAAVGYEILTGHGVNLDLAALAHLGVENWPHLPMPTTLRPQLPAEIDQALMTAMAFERERRPTDCLVFETELEGIMKKHGLSASDKDIARWVDSELRLLTPAYEGATSTVSKPVGAS